MNAQIAYITPKNPPKPLPFKVLCILAFFFGGSTLFFSILTLFTLPEYYVVHTHARQAIFPEDLRNSSDFIISFIFFLLSAVAFAGLIGIWRLQKIGYWIFFVSIILFVILPFVLFDMPFVWIITYLLPYQVIAVFLLILFGKNLKLMRKRV